MTHIGRRDTCGVTQKWTGNKYRWKKNMNGRGGHRERNEQKECDAEGRETKGEERVEATESTVTEKQAETLKMQICREKK